jgi:osmotically inducible protein OsmC
MVMRAATANWEGELFTGKGTVSLDSSNAAGPLDVNWPARAENPEGVTSPEELIAAAHATCFSMSLSGALTRAGTPPETISTTAECHIEKTDAGFTITRIELSVTGSVPGIDAEAFEQAAQGAKAGCPVSRALSAVDISVSTTLS